MVVIAVDDGVRAMNIHPIPFTVTAMCCVALIYWGVDGCVGLPTHSLHVLYVSKFYVVGRTAGAQQHPLPGGIISCLLLWLLLLLC